MALPTTLPEEFDFEGYVSQVRGEAVPEGGFNDDQKRVVFEDFTNNLFEETLKARGISKSSRDSLAVRQEIIDQHGAAAREVFNAPAPVENADEFLSLDSILDEAERNNEDGLLDNTSIGDLIGDRADQITSEAGYFQFPQFRESQGRSRTRIKKSLESKILGGASTTDEFGDVIPLDSNTTLRQMLDARQARVQTEEDAVDPRIAKQEALDNPTLRQRIDRFINPAADVDAPTDDLEAENINGAAPVVETPTEAVIDDNRPARAVESTSLATPIEKEDGQVTTAGNEAVIDEADDIPRFESISEAVDTLFDPKTTEGLGDAIGSGFTDLAGKAAEGVANLGRIFEQRFITEENKGAYRFFTKNEDGEVDFIRYFPPGAAREAIIENAPQNELKQFGRDLQDYAKDVNSTLDQNSGTFKTGQVIGQLAGFIGTGLVSKTGALLTAVSSGGEFLLDDYEATLLKKGEKFNPEEADRVALYGSAIGSLESLPAFSALGRLVGANTTPKVLKWLDASSDGALLRVMKNGFKGGLEEGLQEVTSQIAQNWVARDLVAYDEERNLFKGGVESAQVGFAAGGILNGLLGLVSGTKRAKGDRSTDPIIEPETIPGLSGEQLQNNTQVVDENIPNDTSDPVQPGDTIQEAENEPDGDTGENAQDTVNTSEEEAQVQGEETQEVTEYGTKKGNNPFKSEALAEKAIERVARENNIAVDQLEVATADDGYVVRDVSSSPAEVVEDTTQVVDNTETTNVVENSSSELEVITDPPIATPNPEEVVEVTPMMRDNITRDIPTVQSEIEKGNFRLAHARTRTIMRDSNPEQKATFVEGVDLESLKTEQDPLAQDIVGFIEGTGAVVAPNDSATLSSIPDTGEPIVNTVRQDDIPVSTNNIRPDDFIVESVKTPITVPIKTTKQGVSLDSKATKQALEEGGFIVVASTPKTITSYKDGVIYQQKVVTNKNKGSTVRTVIKDLDGVSFRSGPRSQQIAQSGNQTTSNVSLTPVTKGVKLIAGKDGTTLIEPASADEFATRIGGEITIHDRDLLIIKVDDDHFVLHENEGRFSIVKNDGNSVTSDGTVDVGQALQVIDSSTPNLSVTTKQLEGRGYEVSNVSVKNGNTVITLDKEGSETITVSKKGQRGIRVKSGLKNVPVDELNSLLGEVSAPPKVDESELRSVERDEYMDNTDILAGAETTEAGVKIVNEGGLDVDLEIDRTQENAEAMADIFLASTGNTSTLYQQDVDPDNPHSRDWTIEQVKEKLEVLPDHIRRMIQLETNNEVLDSRGQRVRGFFVLKGIDGPKIVIDARPTHHSFNDVMDTISHELSHFSTESWLTPGMSGVIDRAFEILKPNMATELPQYIRLYGNDANTPIDLENPTAHQKWLLVHEYLAKLNTSLLDVDSVTNLGSLTPDQITALKTEVSGELNEVVLDLTADINNPAEAKKFLENIIRLQAGWINSNGVRLDVKQGDASITVRATPRGRETVYLNGTSEAAQAAELFRIRKRMLAGDPLAYIQFGYHKYVRGLVGRQLLPDSIVRSVDGGLSNFTKRFVSSIRKTESDRVLVQAALDSKLPGSLDKVREIEERLKAMNDDYSSAVEAELAIQPDFSTNITESRVSLLIKAGYDPKKKKSIFKAAKSIDDLHGGLQQTQHDKVAEIRQQGREQERVLNGILKDLTEKGLRGKAGETIGQTIINIRQFISRFDTDYAHRQYEAYTPQGVKDLELIQSSLVTAKQDSEGLDSLASKAREKITKVRTAREAGTINEIKARKKILELFKPIELLYQKELILMWARRNHRKADGSPIEESEVRRLARERIDKIVEQNLSSSDSSTTQKMQLIDGVRGRRLDPELDTDRLLMRFLKPISDPTEIAIGTLEQQNKVAFTLAWAAQNAKNLYNSGLALPVGSTKPEDWVGSSRVFDGQEGTALSILEVPKFVQEELDSMASIHNNQHQSTVTGFAANLFSAVKRNQTVNNIDVLTLNYVGNLGLIAMSGHLAYVGRYFPTKKADGTYETGPAWQTTKDLFKERLSFGLEEGDAGNQIIQEMNDNFISQSGAASLDAQVNTNDLIESFVTRVVEAIPDAGVDGSHKVKFLQRFKRVNEVVADVYALGDEYAKVLPYIMNRELMVAKYQDQLNRDDYPTNDDYQDAVLKLAVPEAIQLTAEETFVWAQAPTWVKKVAASRFNPISSNYVMHPVQWLRISAALHAREVKQAQELFNLRGQDSEYKRMLQSRVLSRGVGLASTDLAGIALTATGVGGVQAAYQGALLLANAISGDEDDPEMFDLTAAATISNINTFGGSAYYTPMPGTLDENGDFYGINWLRTNVSNTLLSAPQRDTEFSFGQLAGDTVGSFLGTKIDGNFIRTVINLTSEEPTDGFGNPISKKDAYKKLLKDFIPLPPDYVSKPISRAGVAFDLGKSKIDAIRTGAESPESDAKDVSKLLKTIGLRVKKISPRVELSSLGWEFKRDTNRSSNLELKSITKALSTGDTISTSDAQTKADLLAKEANALHRKYMYHFEGIAQFRDSLPKKLQKKYSNSKIMEYMNVDQRKGNKINLSKAKLKDALAGKNIFLDEIKDDISKTIDRKKTESKTNQRDARKVDQINKSIASLQLILGRLPRN